jgi:SAM-dependent methyltransferase
MALDHRAHTIQERQAAELESWRRREGGREPLTYFVDKLGMTPVGVALIKRYGDTFEGSSTVLELGAGTGWASCLVKHLYPTLHVTATDISPDAIAQTGIWERVFDVHIDEARVATGRR